MQQQGGFFYSVKIIMILVIIGAGFFCGQKIEAAIQDEVLINEIMYDVAGADADNEWVEIYNIGSGAVTIVDGSGADSWRFNDGSNHILTLVQGSLTIAPGGFAIIASNGAKFVTDHPGYNDTVIDTVMSLNNTSDTLKLSVDKGVTFFGEITYQSAWGGNGDGKTIERQSSSWLESSAVGGTPGTTNSSPQQGEVAVCGNGQVESGEQCDDGNLVSGDGCSSTCQTETATSTPEQISDQTSTSTPSDLINAPLVKNNFGDVVINEFVSDPADNEVEWIELYNKAGREIDLTGWWIEEGSKAKTALSGGLGASGINRYKVIDKPAGNLNNGGDMIILYDSGGRIIDQTAYGNWHDGYAEDNAPAASDPFSLARKFDGYNTYNNLNDFAITLKPTKGGSNIIQAEDEVSAEAKAKFDFSSDIFISEILPNPAGDDTRLEFIEIHNAGKREVDLTGWSISNEDSKKKNWENIATGTVIKAGEYLAVFRLSSKIVLRNDQGQVRLFQPLADKPFMAVDYKNVKESWSYNAVDYGIKGQWIWSETPTPGAANSIKLFNHKPEVEFNFPKEVLVGRPVIFDSSDTYDQDDDKLKYVWDFGDGLKNNLANPEHTYFKVGIYKVKLAVSDGQETTEKEKSVNVADSLPPEQPEIVSLSLAARNDNIIINEVFPNPPGADTGQEWVELKNQSPGQVNFINWRVENSNGKYKFKSEQLIEAGAFYVLDNAKSKLAFKNTDDVISLYNDLDELVDQVEYASAVQGEIYARGANGNWFWTTKASPAEENIISLADSEASIKYQTSGAKADANDYAETDLEKIRELEIGSLVKVKGTVAVAPGILGVQIFYIVGSPGMQIYNYKKDFPALRIGDYVEVTGELAQTQGELRIKTKDKNDISLIEHRTSPVAITIKNEEVGEENIGQLITITGEITDKKSASLYIDDGSDEIFVYIKQSTGISTKSLAAGQKVSVTGILSKTQTGLRLLPRRQEDIALIDSAGELEPQVLGEVIESEEWNMAERDKKLELFKYLLIIAGGVIIVLAGLFIKLNKKNL